MSAIDLWSAIWGIVLLGSMALFGVVSVCVTIGGWNDIRVILKKK